MLGGGEQLQMQVELDVVVDGYLPVTGRVRPAQLFYFFGIVGGIFGPGAEVGCLVGIAQVAEGGVGLQPLFVGFVETAESVRCQYFFSFLVEDEPEVVPLRLVHSFVVHGGQGVQLFLAFFELCHRLLVF